MSLALAPRLREVMTGDGADERPSFLGRRVPGAFATRVVTIDAGTTVPFDEAEWDGAIVVLEAGALEVECHDGGRSRFAAGAVIFLVGLELRTLHSVGPEPVRLVAITRRVAPDDGLPLTP
jgi:hypothetical protein